MARLIPISELVAMLAARAPALAAELLPAGRREGGEWVEASKRRGGLGDSLKVCLVGAKAGVWAHFAAGRGGDALDLVAYLATGDDKRAAVAWARRWLGLEAGDPAALAKARRLAKAQLKAAATLQEAEAEKRARQAQALWFGAQELLRGTLAAAYLAGRGIDLERLGRQPRALRYHPDLWNAESGRRWPALLAAIQAPGGRTVAVHRTWLERRRDGRVAKAPLDCPKMTLGPYRGGCIRIWRGRKPDGRRAPPLRAAPAGSSVVLTEGIEDALTVALAMPERRVLCAVSLANMGALELPPTIAQVTICADNDAKGSPAAAALDRATGRFLGQGRRVVLVRPPAGVKDINALLTGEQRTDVR